MGAELCTYPSSLLEMHFVPFCLGLTLQPPAVPLDGSTSLWHVWHSSHFCVIFRFAECALCPIIHIANGDGKQDPSVVLQCSKEVLT